MERLKVHAEVHRAGSAARVIVPTEPDLLSINVNELVDLGN